MGTFTAYFLKGVCRFLSFPRALKVFCTPQWLVVVWLWWVSNSVCRSLWGRTTWPLVRSPLSLSRLGQSTTFVRQQGLHDTTLRQHIFPQWFSISGFFPSKNNLPVLPSRRWKSRLVLTWQWDNDHQHILYNSQVVQFPGQGHASRSEYPHQETLVPVTSKPCTTFQWRTQGQQESVSAFRCHCPRRYWILKSKVPKNSIQCASCP